METLKDQLLAGLCLLLLGSPLIAAQQDCDCVDKCVVWIVVAAILPPMVIVAFALTYKCCTWLNRHRARAGEVIDKSAEEPAEDPVYDFKDDFESPNARSPPIRPTRRRTEHNRAAKTRVSSRLDVVSEDSREESSSDLNSSNSKRVRKKQRKLTDLGKVPTSKVVKIQVAPHVSERDDMGNTCIQKEYSKKKTKKSNAEKINVKPFSSIEEVQDIESEIDTFTISDSEDSDNMAIDKLSSDGHKHESDNALCILDNAISSNTNKYENATGDSDVETSELQELKDRAVGERQYSNTPFPEEELSDMSRPNSPVPDEELAASGILNGHTENLQRSSTPFPLFSGKPQSKRKARPTMAETIIEEIEEEQTENQEINESKGVRKSRKSDEKLITESSNADNPTDVQVSSKNFKDQRVAQDILTRRAVTPTPTSIDIPPMDVTKRRSKTPDPRTTVSGKPRIIKVTEKKDLFNKGFKEKTINPSLPGDTSVGELDNNAENKSTKYTNRHIQKQTSQSPNSFSISQRKPPTYKSAYQDPFVTDYGHSHRHVNETYTQENVEPTHSLQTNYDKTAKSESDKIQSNTSLVKQDDSRANQTYNPTFLNPRSKTPDPFGTRISATKDKQTKGKVRSKTPDPFITANQQPPNSHAKSIDAARGYIDQSKQAKSTLLQNGSNSTNVFSSQFMPSGSRTPDPFANRFSARVNKEFDRVRSKTPDPFIAPKTETPVSEKATVKLSEQRLENLLKTPAKLKGKSKIRSEDETLKDESLSRLIRDASRRAATPDHDRGSTDGLTYNKLFASDMKRSKSVNAPSKPSRRGKLLSYRGSEKRRDWDESKSGGDGSHVDQLEHLSQSIKPQTPTSNTDTSQVPSVRGQSITQATDHSRTGTTDRKGHGVTVIATDRMTEDDRLAGSKEDTFDKLMNTIDGHVKSAHELADSAQRQLQVSTQEPVGGAPDGKVIQSTAAKLRARRQKKLNDTEFLDDDTLHGMTLPDLKPKTSLHDGPLHRSTFSLQGVLKEKPSPISASSPSSMFDQSRDSAHSQDTISPGRIHDGSRTPTLGNRNVTYSVDGEHQTNTAYTSINRAKSPNDRKLFDVEPFATTEEEARRKRKFSSMKVQLPDLAASPKKSILKKPISPPAEDKTELGVFPLSQFVSSAKYGKDGHSATHTIQQPTRGTTRSIMFAGSPTTFGGKEAWEDTKVQRSLSHSERRQRKSALSDRPPTPAVLNRTTRKQNWNMSSTKL